MKIYHTETQADYDVLMEKLEAEGIETLPKERWKNYRCETAVFVHAIDKNHNSSRNDTTYSDVTWALYKYPDIPITKYKAKVDEKMKFNKQNVEKVIDEYFGRADFESYGDLIAEIHNLDDTPEKVVVPKYIADFYRVVKRRELNYVLRRFEESGGKVKEWYFSQNGRYINPAANAQETIAKMHLYGYTIEPEQLYYIPLPDLETSDGTQQVLSKRDTYFASRPNDKLQQRYTKEELEQVPEIYKPYAKPIEEEAE